MRPRRPTSSARRAVPRRDPAAPRAARLGLAPPARRPGPRDAATLAAAWDEAMAATARAPGPPGGDDADAARAGFETMAVERPPGLVSRAAATVRHLVGLLAGALVDRARTRRAARAEGGAGGPRLWLVVAAAAVVAPFVRRDLRDAPFAVQLRRRLELLGPTYIKLGQILALREDLLPPAVTGELRHLLNRLPVVPFDAWAARVEQDLGRPLAAMFRTVRREPLGSASIAQIHRATTRDGDEVVIKVVKPGVRETLERDARLLRALAWLLDLGFARHSPRRIVGEFVEYTLREVDLRREATNAETFAANFADVPDVVFPRIWREYSGRSVLTMEYLAGPRPDTPEAQALPEPDRRRLVDLGAQSIIRMLYADGFFHADLHPGNLVVLPGPKVGFIDLGMVGRLDRELRRALLYYYYALVTGDAETATRYLTALAEPQRGADLAGFRREVAEVSSRWKRAASFSGFSLAQLILESLASGARFRVYFPVELVLMTKALVTFEGVGHVLLPGFDVATVSATHVRRIFLAQFSPIRLLQRELRNAPDLLDALVKVPALVTEGVRVLERSTRAGPSNPLGGLRETLTAGFAMIAGAILLAFGGPWPLWSGLFALALVLLVRRE